MKATLIAVVVLGTLIPVATLGQSRGGKPAAKKGAPATRPAPATAPSPSRGVVFVIDVSGSMGTGSFNDGALTTPIVVAVDEVRRAVEELTPADRFDVVASWEERFSAMSPAMLSADEKAKDAAYAYLESLRSEGTTNFKAALDAVVKLRPATVWLLTDGDNPDFDASIEMAAKAAKQGGFVINTSLRLVPPDADNTAKDFVRRLAVVTGGKCLGVDGKPVTEPIRDPAPNELPEKVPPRKKASGPSTLK